MQTYSRFFFPAILGLVPLFSLALLPAAALNVEDLTPYALIALGVVIVSLVVLLKESFRVSFPYPLAYFLLIPAAFLIAALFSVDARESFFGFTGEMGTVASMLAFFLLVWLCSVTLKDRAPALVMLSCALAASFGVVVSYAAVILARMLFAGESTFIADPNRLAFFGGLTIVLALAVRAYVARAKGVRVLLAVVAWVAVATLALLPLFAVWVSVLLVLAALYAETKFPAAAHPHSADARYSGRRTLIAMCCIGVVLLSTAGARQALVRPPLQFNDNGPGALAVGEGLLSLALHAPARLLVGTGPNTFPYFWNSYRPLSSLAGAQWATGYDHAAGFFPTLMAATGLLGVAAFALCLFILVLHYVALNRAARAKERTEAERARLAHRSVFFIAGLYVWSAFFWMHPSMTVFALAAAVTGGFVAGGAWVRTKSFSSHGGGELPLILATIGAVLLSLVCLQGVAVEEYQNGIDALLVSGNLDQSQADIAYAIRILPGAPYYRALSEIQQRRLAQILLDSSQTPDELRTAIDVFAPAAVANAKSAVALNPSNYLNELVLGNSYAQLAVLKVGGAFQQALATYDKAAAVAPMNPMPLFLKGKALAQNGDYDNARAALQAALALKPDYQDALNLLAQFPSH